MTVAQAARIERRVKALESDVAFLKEQLEWAQTVAGIQRGFAALDAGRVQPAGPALAKLRKKLVRQS